MDDRPSWERELDELVRPTFLADPPRDVQRSILAAVLLATAQPTHAITPLAASAAGRGLSLAAYLLLAAVLVAYVAALSWLQTVLGGGGWLSTLATQLLAVSELVVGRPAFGEPLGLVWLVLQRAPWLLLLPLAWVLWQRDRASVRAI